MHEESENAECSLLVVLSNPPTTSGARTLARVELARKILGFGSVEVVNLFPIPTYRTGGISAAGAAESDWSVARPAISEGIRTSSAVMLAHGCQEPSGRARQHYRNQIAWLRASIGDARLPVWLIDGSPRHPSRWHRHTFAKFPELQFSDAIRLLFHEESRADHSLGAET